VISGEIILKSVFLKPDSSPPPWPSPVEEEGNV